MSTPLRSDDTDFTSALFGIQHDAAVISPGGSPRTPRSKELNLHLMNTYGDVVTDEMAQASGKVARLAINGT